jgi:hypothetical protein
MKLRQLLEAVSRRLRPVDLEERAPAPRWYGRRPAQPERDFRLRQHEGAWSNFVDDVGRRFFGLGEDTATIAAAHEVQEATAYAGLIAFRQRRELEETPA